MPVWTTHIHCGWAAALVVEPIRPRFITEEPQLLTEERRQELLTLDGKTDAQLPNAEQSVDELLIIRFARTTDPMRQQTVRRQLGHGVGPGISSLAFDQSLEELQQKLLRSSRLAVFLRRQRCPQEGETLTVPALQRLGELALGILAVPQHQLRQTQLAQQRRIGTTALRNLDLKLGDLLAERWAAKVTIFDRQRRATGSNEGQRQCQRDGKV
jgi:hypothetical protein